MTGRPSLERRLVGLVGEARLAVQDYGRRVLGEREIERMAQIFNLAIHITETEIPAVLYPPIDGKYRLAIESGLPREVRRYIALHELGHILMGEAEEPMRLVFFGALPESEDICDLFALLGIIDPVDMCEGAAWLERQIRAAVPLEDKGWQVHRIPRLAKRLPEARMYVLDRLDGFF